MMAERLMADSVRRAVRKARWLVDSVAMMYTLHFF